MWDDTVIVVTADHGEQLGDHGLIGKGGFFESSYHVLAHRPRSRASPHGHGDVVDAFTENVDIMPTLCEAIGVGRARAVRRSAAHARSSRGDSRRGGATPRTGSTTGDGSTSRGRSTRGRGTGGSSASTSLCAAPTDAAYVQFGDGAGGASTSPPTRRGAPRSPTRRGCWRTRRRCSTWRSEHADRTLTGMLTYAGGVGRWPAPV